MCWSRFLYIILPVAHGSNSIVGTATGFLSAHWRKNEASNSSFLMKELCTSVIDARTQVEWELGHISCAHRVPVQDDPDRYQGKILNLTNEDLSTPIVVYCASGQRAGVAVDIIKSWGFQSVANGRGYVTDGEQLEQLCECS
eukprot:gnl/MRDRNA2_/MRDRNA2_108349_c0_seq1.p1 gnl/MRDRNA2_/MRDRNA2_108349_c0~~gnl/MRDRNA2_/MRDRNA2_108349_c0_seq1.p1  ORF type:complete len:142 (-),score=19.89 gnl/MRDRNA2_/MRDRNA2_108349_c0_seq1:245-670(-)